MLSDLDMVKQWLIYSSFFPISTDLLNENDESDGDSIPSFSDSYLVSVQMVSLPSFGPVFAPSDPQISRRLVAWGSCWLWQWHLGLELHTADILET